MALSCSSSSVEVRRIESSIPTARSVGTCDSQKTACCRTSASGSCCATSSRRSSVSPVRFWESRNTALRRIPAEQAVFLLSQKRTGETEDLLLDVAQHDPDAEV